MIKQYNDFEEVYVDNPNIYKYGGDFFKVNGKYYFITEEEQKAVGQLLWGVYNATDPECGCVNYLFIKYKDALAKAEKLTEEAKTYYKEVLEEEDPWVEYKVCPFGVDIKE